MQWQGEGRSGGVKGTFAIRFFQQGAKELPAQSLDHRGARREWRCAEVANRGCHATRSLLEWRGGRQQAAPGTGTPTNPEHVIRREMQEKWVNHHEDRYTNYRYVDAGEPLEPPKPSFTGGRREWWCGRWRVADARLPRARQIAIRPRALLLTKRMSDLENVNQFIVLVRDDDLRVWIADHISGGDRGCSQQIQV